MELQRGGFDARGECTPRALPEQVVAQGEQKDPHGSGRSKLPELPIAPRAVLPLGFTLYKMQLPPSACPGPGTSRERQKLSPAAPPVPQAVPRGQVTLPRDGQVTLPRDAHERQQLRISSSSIKSSQLHSGHL